MMGLRRDKKEEADDAKGGQHAFSNLEKTSVLQEARVFNETPVNPRKCTQILSKILYLINQGETLGTTEATETFFAITKLFQVKIFCHASKSKFMSVLFRHEIPSCVDWCT